MTQAQHRPTVLVVDADGARRRVLSESLARAGYEIAPAVSAGEGAAYLAGLQPAVVVLPAALVFHPSLAEPLGARAAEGLRVIAVGEAGEEESLPRWALFLGTAGLTVASFLERLSLLVLAEEIGVEADAELGSLVGELSHHPFHQLLGDLNRARATGSLELPSGTVFLKKGRPVAASAGTVHGLKAFCRLARTTEGPFHLRLGEATAQRELEDDVATLLARADEDAAEPLPDPRTRIRVDRTAAGGHSASRDPFQDEVLSAAEAGATLRRTLDSVKALDGEIVEELRRLQSQGVVIFEEPETPVAVVTDSTADLPPAAVERLGLSVLPLRVFFGDDSFRDGVDLSPKAFYQRLRSNPNHPFTNPPTREEFRALYRQLLARRDVVSIHISEHIPSETVVHGRQAAEAVLSEKPERRDDGSPLVLEVVDSRLASGALGLLAVLAGRLAARGLPAREIRQRVESMAPRIQTLFVVDTLDFLARGGRIGKAQAWIGNLLGIKPILGLEDGRVAPVDKVRGGRRAHSRLIEVFSRSFDRKAPTLALVAHAEAPVWADRLGKLLEDSFAIRELFRAEIGPVIGTHVGPGTVGAALFQPEPEESPLIAPLDG